MYQYPRGWHDHRMQLAAAGKSVTPTPRPTRRQVTVALLAPLTRHRKLNFDSTLTTSWSKRCPPDDAGKPAAPMSCPLEVIIGGFPKPFP
eukprot:g64999.t1